MGLGPTIDDIGLRNAVSRRVNASDRRRVISVEVPPEDVIFDQEDIADSTDEYEPEILPSPDRFTGISTSTPYAPPTITPFAPSTSRPSATRTGRFSGRSTVIGTSSRGTGRIRDDTSWIVTGVVSGGPVDGSVIPSFLGHIAYSMQEQGYSREVLRTHTRKNTVEGLRRWYREMPERTRDLLADTGLDHLCSCYHETIDAALISAFVERWQPDTNSFHLPVGEMTILLHDVYNIMRIPIAGNFVDMVSNQDMDFYFRSLVLDDLSIFCIYLDGSNRLIGYSDIVNKLRGDGVESGRAAQGWLMVALGCILFTCKNSSRFKPREVVETSDLGSVWGYSWGSATLAYLYRQLGTSSRTYCKSITGCLSLLQTWIYEYFPCFRPSGMEVTGERMIPLAAAWRNTRALPRTQDRLEAYRARIDRLTADDVIWCPYGDAQYYFQTLHQVHPNATYRGLIGYREYIEPYMPDRCIRQLGYVQMVPHPIMTPDDQYRGADVARYNVHWAQGSLRVLWDAISFIQLPVNTYVPAFEEGKTSPEYMRWYRAHSHPVMGAEFWDQSIPDKWICAVFYRLAPAFASMEVAEPDDIYYSLDAVQELWAAYMAYGLACSPPPPPDSQTRSTRRQYDGPSGPTPRQSAGPSRPPPRQSAGPSRPLPRQSSPTSSPSPPPMFRRRRRQ